MKLDERPLEEKVAWTVEEAREAIDHERGYTVNEHTGCWYQLVRTAVGYGSYLTVYCNTPEAPVWMGDYGFKPIGDVKAGEEIIGWTMPAPPARRRLVRTRVLATARRVAPVVRVTLASGNVIRCTPDHQWLRSRAYDSPSKPLSPWITAKAGRDLSRVVDIPEALPPDLERLAAWLGGIYDGEGSKHYIAQEKPHIRSAIAHALQALGLPYTECPKGFYLVGGRPTYQRFAALTRPVHHRSLDPVLLTARIRAKDRVVSVEPEGEGEVISMQTATGNYVVWGYASKNCAVFGDPPPGWEVYHRCHGGRRGCIRPTHLDITDGTAVIDADPGLSPVDRNTFAARIRFEREARRATLTQFARELGVSLSTLSAWEMNTSSPTQDDFGRISRRLGWDGALTKWVTTVVVQQTVAARCAGDAAAAVMESLEREQGDRNLALYGVVRASEIPRLRRMGKGRALPRPAIDVTMADIIRRAKTPEALLARRTARQRARVLNEEGAPKGPLS